MAGFLGNFAITALCADLSAAIDEIEDAAPGNFGDHGAYGCGTGFIVACYATAALVAPEISGPIKAAVGFGNMALVLAVWCLSVAFPVLVSLCTMQSAGLGLLTFKLDIYRTATSEPTEPTSCKGGSKLML